MKKSMYRTVFFLVVFAGISTVSFSQTKPSAGERQKDFEKQRLKTELRQQELQEKLEEIKSEKGMTWVNTGESGNYVFASPDVGFHYTGAHSGQSSQLSLSKSFDGESTKNEGSFEVDENVKYINYSVNGRVKEGKIKINIILPGGEKLKEMTIDNTADIQFNQMIRPRSAENKYSGKWTYEIEAIKAVGNYRLSLQTN